MKRLLLPALLLLSSPAWADIAPDRDWQRPAAEPKPAADPKPATDPKPSPETASETKGRSGCMAATSLSIALAALMASWLTRGRRQAA